MLLDALFQTAEDLAAGVVVTCVLILFFCIPLIIKANRKVGLQRVRAFDYKAALRPIGSAPLDRHFSEDHPGRERVGYVARHNSGRRG